MNSTAKVNYLHVFITYIISFLILWLLPLLFGKYTDSNFPYIMKEDVISELVGLVGPNRDGLTWCPIESPYLLKGLRLYNYDIRDSGLDDETFADNLDIQIGGVWQTVSCQARYQVVIVIPYRDRKTQLKKFLQYMHPYLQRQQLYYRIIVVEQGGNKPFNRGKLLNIGYMEALKLGSPSHCFIFHDVDLLPQSDWNIYACTHQPRHMYSALDTFRYHLPYRRMFGGAVAMQGLHFQNVNGFSNVFSGWGGEDDDLFSRLEEKGLEVTRFDPEIASYVMMPHLKQVPSPKRWDHLSESLLKLRNDGLTTLRYAVEIEELKPLYSYYLVSW